jgi:Ca2+/Na+ antiporter
MMNILATIIILWYIIGIIACTSYMIIYNKKYHQETHILDIIIVALFITNWTSLDMVPSRSIKWI